MHECPYLNNKGFTLVEITIASSLALVLLLTIVQIYIGYKEFFNVQDALARLQERGRLISQLLYNDIRTAGFVGCGSLNNSFSLMPNMIYGYNSTESIEGINKSGDALLIQKMSEQTATLLNSTTDNHLHVSATPIFKNSRLVVIADCLQADIVKIINTNKTSEAQELFVEKMLRPYAKFSQVGYFISNLYYISKTGRNNLLGKPIYALYKKDISGNTMEVVEGVEDMQILYGVDLKNNGTISEYQSAGQVLNWQQVKSVDIQILLNSVEEILTAPQSFIFKQKTLVPKDRLARQVWNTYVALRERNG